MSVLPRSAKSLLLGTAVLSAAACAWVEDRSDRYMTVKPAEPLEVPEVFEGDTRLSDRYPIPAAEKAFIARGSFKVPAAPQPQSEISESLFNVRKSDDAVWLSTSEPPGRIWPAMKQYWESHGADVSEDRIEEGIMVVEFPATSAKASSWTRRHELKMPASDPMGAVAMQIEVTQGLKKKSSEIRIQSLDYDVRTDALAPDAPDETLEPGRSPELMLKSLAYGLSQSVSDFNTYSLVAQRIDSEQRVRLVTDGMTVPYIQVKLNEGRAWFELEQAVLNSRFDLIDQNRANGRLFIQYDESRSGEEPGFMASWFSDDEDTDTDRLSDDYNFQIELKNVSDELRVYVLPRNAGVPYDISTLSGNEQHRADSLTILNEVMEKLG
ncbi:outer membrane protein assembly factor BamC [Allohahella marinimesophila]|uniref:Beta-barrel assembly machine subunit BamC n=1 Tax=Allohahella marinimesophila TaxID=1054972 RepID=A0ABP7NP25_9GAMM